ncbi:MAG TPA: serine/threonine-protein kinase [Candidatus Acidoferrales bacterium]|nr:serine/threonine-protein kinase [Candidatus Acidoferrales bacterium]
MGTNDRPNDQPQSSDSDSADRTLSTGERGGVAAGQIGPYRLLQLIGEGGMGEVWLAEQKAPIRRTVALKLIKAGMDTKAVVARFESERQALAMMDHANIAQVYDVGSTAEGRPYFAMEYVPGAPITEYCDKHRLTMKERLELFMHVCDGVQHAHQKAIIHRDLKPSNVLVAEQDNTAVPKIIDFGLAKAMGQRLTDKTMFTELGVLIGTPEYMSPEQADLREQNIDTRTDVYSLGVILYELLVGSLPFDAKALRAAGLDAILRMIREVEPPKPSTKVRSMGDDSAASAEKRKEEPRTFARHLQGELDWITMKALEKDRTRRYAAPSELSADISRYLHSEPVLAGPATTAYRVRKYVARHRFGLGAAATLLVLLAGFVVTQAVELHRIRLERDRANRERDRATRVTDFMTRMFKVSDPSEARGNSITAREILDKASTDVDTGLTKDPELQAQMMHVMGNVYANLGLNPRALSLDQRALEIRRRVLGPEHPDTLRSMNSLASDLIDGGHYAEAEKLDRETLGIRRRVLGLEHADTLTSMNNLADDLAQEGQYAEAEKLYREALDTQRRVLGPEHPDTLRSMGNLANVLKDEGRYGEAAKLDRETFDVQRRVLGPEHPETLGSMTNLAVALYREGHYAEAEKLYRDALNIKERVLGPEHQGTLRSMANLGNVLKDEGRYAEAEKLYRETLDVQRRVLGPEHPETLASMNNLGDVLEDEHHYAEAEKLFRETLDIRRRVLGPDRPLTLTSMNNLANILDDEGHYAEAEKLDRETLGIQRRVLGPEHPQTLNSANSLANVLVDEGRYDEAEKLDRETLDVQKRVLGPDHPDTAFSVYNLGCIAARRDHRDEAFALLREAIDHGLQPSTDLGIEGDTDLKSLRGDPRFAALVSHAKERATAAQRPN